MKAVVWTDALQTIVIIIGVVLSFIAAMVRAGGITNVFDIGAAHGRVNAIV